MSPHDSLTSTGKDSNVMKGSVPEKLAVEQSLDDSRNDVVDSLGEALAGMTASSNPQVPSFGSGALSSASAPFVFAPSGAATSGTSTSNDQRQDGWAGFPEQSQVSSAFKGSFGGSLEHSGASDTPSKGHSDGLELFLSKPSSQSIPEDVFRLSHPNLRSLGQEDENKAQIDSVSALQYNSSGPKLSQTSGTSSFGEMRSTGDSRRRTESPSCSVTGTTTSSRSVSPYANSNSGELIGGVGGNGRVIQAYPRFESVNSSSEVVARTQPSFTDDDRSSSGYSLSQAHGSNPSLATLESTYRSPYGKDRMVGQKTSVGSPYDQGPPSDRSAQLQHAVMESPQQSIPSQTGGKGQPQVLYMAVPSPDGRGQVLQPVQMVQVAGKPGHFLASGDSSTAVVHSGDASDYQNPMAGAETRSSMENRSRLASYAVDKNSSRQYGVESSMMPSLDEYGRSASGGYQVDSSVASLYSAPQRPPLDALLGQVRRLSRDQVGCRLVQQALDEEGPMAATLILNEGLPFWGEAMVDPFGNYLFQKVLEKVTPEERIMLVKSVSPRLVNASLNLHGTRSVQKVVELCWLDEQNGHNEGVEESSADILASALAPAAARLCIDSHGNHVIQRILLKLSPKHTKFVFDAVAVSVGDVARHRHGCCVIQRCLDSPSNEARAHLVNRIVDKALELMQDAYGNYVVQYVLDVCSDADVQAVCEAVVGKVNLLAIQKFSSNVMEKCLERCNDRVKELYLEEMSDPDRIRELMMDPFGNYVVQRALSVATHAQAIRLVEAMRPHLLATQLSGPHGHRNGGVRNTAGGRRIIAKICRRFPNFTLNPVGSQDELYSSNKASNRHLHHQSPVVTGAYNPVRAHAGQQTYAPTNLRMSHGQHLPVVQPQHQSYYSVGAPTYYDHQYASGHGGFPGM